MPTDPRKEPESNDTVAMPKVPDWAIEMTRAMKEGFKTTNANIELVSTDLGVVKDRLVIVESWKSEQDLRASKLSGGVKNLSQSDEGQNMQISSLAVKVDALSVDHAKLQKETAKQTAMLSTITDLLDKPLVKTLGKALAGLAIAACAAGTGYLARGNVQTPQPTIIQVAPVVTADGGAR